MKFNFKIQQYQTDVVDAVVKVFSGQGYQDKTKYIRDKGVIKNFKNFMGENIDKHVTVDALSEDDIDIYSDTGYKNELVELSDEQLLHNI